MSLDFTVLKSTFREFAITILDDNDGITDDAKRILYPLLIQSGNEDIIYTIREVKGKIFLPEWIAQEELEKLKKEIKK